MKSMKSIKNLICAYNKTSDAGIDTSSFSVFMDRCNLCCPYCMNGKLITKREDVDPGILKRLKKDVDEYKPQMIFISGGEPTESPLALFSAISLFKSWGCKIGVSTNGTNPEILKKFVSEYGKIDYVAMDLKGNADVYKKLGNIEYFMRVMSSWLILRAEKKTRSEFNYEIRTTLYPPFITPSVLGDMSRFFTRDEKWVLQQFRVVSSMPYKNAKRIKPYSEDKLKEFCASICKTVPKITIRYI